MTPLPFFKRSADQKLEWFPEPFGQGGLEGIGTEKLLGRPHIEPLELLVREAAQNAWDARSGAGTPEFGVAARVLSTRDKEYLSDTVFPEAGQSTLVETMLGRRNLGVLELHDRGTTGLNGPVRADAARVPGQPTNFVDLVFNVGTANKNGSTGGSFGFGKTSAFRASRSRLVIYWSVCMTAQGREHRLIVGGLGKAFDRQGKRYTGRHWWGRVDGERVVPVTGALAEEVGDQLFSRDFGPGETGTSIMVLDTDPNLLTFSDANTRTEMEPGMITGIHTRIRRMMYRNLWPKIAGRDGRPAMRLSVGGEALKIEEEASEFPELASYRVALDAVRAAQSTDGFTDTPSTFVREIRTKRPKALVGRLAITWALEPVAAAGEGVTRSERYVEVPWNSVCWMRNQAELVVRYREYSALSLSGIRWVAVFKPENDMDGAFSAAETPAHDDWIHTSMEAKAERTYVKRGIELIWEEVRDFLSSMQAQPERGSEQSTGALATALADLSVSVPTGPGHRKPGNPGGPRGSRSSGPQVSDVHARLLPSRRKGMVGFEVSFQASGPDVAWTPETRIVLDASVATEEGNLSLSDFGIEPVLEWGEGLVPTAEGSLSAFAAADWCGGSRGSLRVDLPAGMAYALGVEAVS